MTAPTLSRVLHSRDDRGALRAVRIESTDPAELDRVERLYRALERRSEAKERRFLDGHATFTDLGVEPGAVAESRALPPSKGGYPWEGPRFTFALLLGEGRTWGGPQEWYEHVATELVDGRKVLVRSYYGNEASSPETCAVTGGVGELAPHECCLHCCKTGRDLVIPKGLPRTERKSHRKGKLRGGVG